MTFYIPRVLGPSYRHDILPEALRASLVHGKSIAPVVEACVGYQLFCQIDRICLWNLFHNVAEPELSL